MELRELLAKGIRTMFDYYGIRPEITDAYLSERPKFCAGPTRSDLGKLNRLTAVLSMMKFRSAPKGLFPMRHIRVVNDMPVSYTYVPLERMLEGLEKRYGMKPICCPAFTLTAVLDTGMEEAKRTLNVPAGYPFAELHRILQCAFDWNDWNPYEFIVGEVHLLPSRKKTAFPRQDPAKTLLSSLLKEGDTFAYHYYDSEEGWTISIHVDALLPEDDQPYAVCTSSEGTAPPEEIGGPAEFKSFMEANKDVSYPELSQLEKRNAWPWSKTPDIRSINMRIRC